MGALTDSLKNETLPAFRAVLQDAEALDQRLIDMFARQGLVRQQIQQARALPAAGAGPPGIGQSTGGGVGAGGVGGFQQIVSDAVLASMSAFFTLGPPHRAGPGPKGGGPTFLHNVGFGTGPGSGSLAQLGANR